MRVIDPREHGRDTDPFGLLKVETSMKRLGLATLTVLAFGVGVHACAAPEELDPTVLRGGEEYYFLRSASQTPAPGGPSSTGPVNTAPVAPNTGAPPPVLPATTAPLAPAAPNAALDAADPSDLDPAGRDVEDDLLPPDSISLDAWLQQAGALRQP